MKLPSSTVGFVLFATLVSAQTPPPSQQPAKPPAQPAQAPRPRPKPQAIQVTVRDQAGTPLSFVHVNVSGAVSRTLLTNADGMATLQALEKAIQACPDLIVTDIAVPGIDGIELCRRLRADERTRSVPVLAITGYGDRRYPDRAIDAGADHVLIKPCGPDVLVSEARRLLAAGPRVGS